MKPLAEQNLYEILEVPPDAAEDEIVKAWDRLSALCAPGALATYTLMPADDAALLGRRLEEALTVLLDRAARERYDAGLSLTPLPRGAGCDGATATGPEEAPRPRVLPPVIRPRPVPPVIQPMRELPRAEEGAPPAPIPLEHVAPPAAQAAAPAADPAPATAAEPAPAPPAAEAAPAPAAPAPIALVTPAPVAPPFAAVAEAPRPTPPPAAFAATPPPGALAAVAPPAPEIIVGDGTRYTGDVLRRAREARGITLQQLCEKTKITRHHLENLEADRFDRLPAVVYLRGILMALAKELRLDGQKVARSYLEAVVAAAPPAPAAPPARASQR